MGIAAFGNDAHAYPITFATGNTGGTPFNALNDGSFQAATGGNYIYTTFTYTGPLQFQVGPPQNGTSAGDLNSTFFGNGTITGYTPGGTLPGPSNANFTSLSSFLASSGSAANYQYGSILVLDLGTLAAGTVLTIDHDDGASVYQNNARVGTTTAGPTSEVLENVRLTASGDTVVVYSRENGAPSVLSVAVPEPASMALLGAGLAALGLTRRRKA